MKNILPRILWLIIGIFIISFLYSFFSNLPFLIAFVNSFFVMGLLLLMIGSFTFVVEKGFFNGIIYSIKRFRKSTQAGKFFSKYDNLDSTKPIHEEYLVKRTVSITQPFLIVGGLLTFISIVAAYYLA
ncbi:DUF3899 domain-containing protein [Bacillus spongiae]|uniref:DUF3899 domain-containing protein n=1 Tax=Bacillus spongiae TaxID=2683610 RepID=A0ABU8HBD0_9BACI